MKKIYWFKGVWKPASWEGWASVLIYGLVLLLVVWESKPADTAIREVLVREAPTVAFATLILLVIVWFKGEKPHWRK